MKKLKRISIFVAAVLCCAAIVCISYYEYYNVIPFQRGIGLTSSQVAKIEVSSFTIAYSTTDPQKIDAFYNALKDEKMKRDWHPQVTAGTGYVVTFYPKHGKGYILYHSSGSNCFIAFGGYTGGLPNTTYHPENYGQVAKIIGDFYASLGGKS